MSKEDDSKYYSDIYGGTVLVEDSRFYQDNATYTRWDGVNFIKAHAVIPAYEAPYVCLVGQSVDSSKPTQDIVLTLHTALQLRDWLNDNLEGPEGFIEQARSVGSLSEGQLQSLFPLLSDREKERSSNLESICDK